MFQGNVFANLLFKLLALEKNEEFKSTVNTSPNKTCRWLKGTWKINLIIINVNQISKEISPPICEYSLHQNPAGTNKCW